MGQERGGKGPREMSLYLRRSARLGYSIEVWPWGLKKSTESRECVYILIPLPGTLFLKQQENNKILQLCLSMLSLGIMSIL